MDFDQPTTQCLAQCSAQVQQTLDKSEDEEQLCTICFNSMNTMTRVQHNDESCRCTKKRYYCRECILGWYVVVKHISCPICKGINKNQLFTSISEDDMLYASRFNGTLNNMLNITFADIRDVIVEEMQILWDSIKFRLMHIIRKNIVLDVIPTLFCVWLC